MEREDQQVGFMSMEKVANMMLAGYDRTCKLQLNRWKEEVNSD